MKNGKQCTENAKTKTRLRRRDYSECLPPRWPGFNSRSRCMCVEFVVGSLLCSKRFFSGCSGFPLPSKANISKFQFDPGMHRHFWTTEIQYCLHTNWKVIKSLYFHKEAIKIDSPLIMPFVHTANFIPLPWKCILFLYVNYLFLQLLHFCVTVQYLVLSCSVSCRNNVALNGVRCATHQFW